jgi:tRNA A-37 threonylcarbamoyl transferase component Bud32
MAAWSHATGELGGAHQAGTDRYARGGELGRGGMGVVEAAVDTWLDRDVAIKRPRTDRSGHHLARLTREARLTARLVHPAIPPIYDVGEDEQGPFYTMPVLVGATLHERIEAGGSSLRVLVNAVATACQAAGQAHAHGVVHRDLKPANVLLGDHGEVWVLDWGVALDPADPDAVPVGTPGFQAPEVLAGSVVTPAADVYSLGKTLRSVLLNRTEPRPELWAVVDRATRDDPRARYADGAALGQELDRWLDGRLVQAHAYPLVEVLRHLVHRWRAPLVVAGVATVALSVLGLGALRAQQAERARADHNLSASLALQAASLREHDARPEAEVLAAHALTLGENPLARGVLMAWDVSPPVRLDRVEPLPCERPLVVSDGHVLCLGDPLRLFGPDGQERWSAANPPPTAIDGRWVGEMADARRYEGDMIVLRRTSNHLELWRAGVLRHTLNRAGTFIGLAHGPLPAVHDEHRVGLIDPQTGAIAWGPPTCEHIELVHARAEAVLIGCREAQVYLGTFETPGEPIVVPSSPSALTWQDGPVVGTFEGHLSTRQGEGWRTMDAGVGAVRQLVALPGHRLAVAGERGRARILAPNEGVVLATLPQGAGALAATPTGLRTWGHDVRDYVLPSDLRPVLFDRRDQGGISSFDVSPAGTWLIAGSATGEVASWNLATGAAQQEVPPGDATAKGTRFLDERAWVHAVVADGTIRREIGSTRTTNFSTTFARDAEPFEGGLAVLPWSAAVVLVGATERSLPLVLRPVAATVTTSLWVADERGGMHTLEQDRLVHRFDLEAPSGVLAATGDVLLAADGASLLALTEDGTERWRWTGSAPISSLTANEVWIAAGDLEGRLLLLRPDGTLVARLTAHARRVSGLALRGEVLYSASWDGTVRAWSLPAAVLDPAVWVERATRTWGLSLDEALAGADLDGARP